ncbi:9470_t:CDS:1, partial [Dentiscutata heterogama]
MQIDKPENKDPRVDTSKTKAIPVPMEITPLHPIVALGGNTHTYRPEAKKSASTKQDAVNKQIQNIVRETKGKMVEMEITPTQPSPEKIKNDV